MNIVRRKISELKHPKYNPRQISEKDFKHLCKSLETFAAVEPAVINTHKGREGIIIGGNQRIRAAQALGWDEYPCYEIELEPKKERELNIRLNKNTGEWDMDLLANNFDVGDLVDWGFNDEDFDMKKDLSNDLDEPVFQIIIKCESEKEQQNIYLKLKKLDIKCELLSV